MHLAQLNIALAKYDMDAPEIKDFVDNVDAVNNIAEQSAGFVWRLKDESGDATSIQAFNDPKIIVNMSVWQDVDSLKDFMFKTFHRDIMKRKSEWFEPPKENTYVLWWVNEGHIPTLEEAKERLYYLRENGETPHAFSFKTRFTPNDVS